MNEAVLFHCLTIFFYGSTILFGLYGYLLIPTDISEIDGGIRMFTSSEAGLRSSICFTIVFFASFIGLYCNVKMLRFGESYYDQKD